MCIMTRILSVLKHFSYGKYMDRLGFFILKQIRLRENLIQISKIIRAKHGMD